MTGHILSTYIFTEKTQILLVLVPEDRDKLFRFGSTDTWGRRQRSVSETLFLNKKYDDG
jgi:hypothetical protein